MLQHDVFIPLSKVNLKNVQKIHVPAHHTDQDIITIMFETLAPMNEKEIWKHEFVNNKSSLLLRQQFNELFYLDTHHFLLITEKSICKYEIDLSCQITHSIPIPRGDCNRFDIVTHNEEQFLFHLNKQIITVESEGKQTTANQYTLTTYSAESLQVVNEVKFQASVRSLILVPISRTKCFMMNPNSPTNKTLQFIIYDETQPKSKTIQIKETQRELRGTIVKVLIYQNQLIFIYNSNGTEQQFITFYCLENGNEINHSINLEQPYQIRDAFVREDRILFTCFNNQFDQFTFLFDILDKSVRIIEGGECNQLYGRNVMIGQNNDYITLTVMANSNLMMTHFIDKIQYDLSIRQELSEM